MPHDKRPGGKTRHDVTPCQHGRKCHMDTGPVFTPRVTLWHRFATYDADGHSRRATALSRRMYAALTGRTHFRDEVWIWRRGQIMNEAEARWMKIQKQWIAVLEIKQKQNNFSMTKITSSISFSFEWLCLWLPMSYRLGRSLYLFIYLFRMKE